VRKGPDCEGCGARLRGWASRRCRACQRAIGLAPLFVADRRARSGFYDHDARKASSFPTAHQAAIDRRMRRGDPFTLRSRGVRRYRRF
jgi:hypothetical protein